MLESRTYTCETPEGLSVAMDLTIQEGQITDDSIQVSIPDCHQSLSINMTEANSLVEILQKCLAIYDCVDHELNRGKE